MFAKLFEIYNKFYHEEKCTRKYILVLSGYLRILISMNTLLA